MAHSQSASSSIVSKGTQICDFLVTKENGKCNYKNEAVVLSL